MAPLHAADDDTLIIEPLVQRHVGDAAFYWAQHDSSVHSPQIDLGRLLHFDRLLQAHLDGIVVAGQEGWKLAFEELDRWKGASETFVCAYLALHDQDGERLRTVWGRVEADVGRNLRGLVSALNWVGADRALPWLERWVGADHNPALQVTALRAAVLGDELLLAPAKPLLPRLAASPAAPVRAATARLAGQLDPAGPVLATLLRDDDPVVRAEAAIALGWNAANDAAPLLWKTCAEWIGNHHALQGWPRFQAERRLGRWLRYLGALLPPGHPAVPRLLSQLPPRLGLLLALHHADPAHLPWVVTQMDAKETSRFAGWVWSMLTGVALDEADMVVTEPEIEEELSLLSRDQDAGLPEPAPDRVRAWMDAYATRLPHGTPCLFGQALTDTVVTDLLCNGPQALRWMAALRMPQLFFNIREPAWRQCLLLEQFQQSAAA
ncbi:HEAT repeat domain-containing protein [Chitinimonas lacunae]|uniref:HEAT repeat domain-containing protein n=1 Tax=Chitinimonas lacunae TaxID=1963018 RepID=A0ABV8MV42_9NEIS